MRQHRIRRDAGLRPRVWGRSSYPQTREAGLMPHRKVPRWIWRRTAPPKWLTIITATGYLLALGAGGYAIPNQPSSIEGAIGELAMYSVSTLLIIAGLLGTPTSLFGEWKVERYAALLAFIATFFYVLIVLALHVEGDGNRLLQAGEVSIAGLAMLARTIWTWRRPLAPREETLLGRDSRA